MTANEAQSKIFRKAFFLLFAVFFLYLSLQVHWSDSELWSIGLAKSFFAAGNPSLDYKSFFNFSLHLPYLLFQGNLHILEGARLLYAALGLTLLWQTYKILRRSGYSLQTSCWGFVFLAGSTLFLSQGFKVRSDILASVFQMVGVTYFLSLFQKRKNSTHVPHKELLLSILLNFLVLLATPKAVYHLTVNFVFIFLVLSSYKVAWRKKYLVLNFALPFIFFLLLAGFKYSEFITALDFFLKSYKESPYHPAFWDAKSFEFVADAALHNIPLILLLIGGLFIKRWRGSEKMTPAFAGASLASLFFIFIHNDRLPFFIFSLSAFPIMFAAIVWQQFSNRLIKAFMIGFLLINGVLYIRQMLQAAGSGEQVRAIQTIEAYLRNHGNPLYYDATSVLPQNNQIYIFPAPQHPGNQQEVLETLNRPNLLIVFFGNRLFYYMTPFYTALEDHYFIEINPGVFVRSHAIRNTHLVTDEEWKNFCTQFQNPGKVYAYTGSSFTSMKLSDSTLSCHQEYRNVLTADPFIALTPFEPLPLPPERSFAQIFDHRPFY